MKNNFFAELRRRNVYKIAVAYAVVAWLLIQIATQVFPFLQIPSWAIRLIIMLLALGFPIALVIAWAFESTPEGIKRTDATETVPHQRRHSWLYIVGGGAAISIGLFFLGRYTGASKPAVAANSPSAKSIAVLPFESLSEDKANAYFAEGVHDEILTRLAKIADLKVISRTSTEQYKSKPGNLSEIAQQLGVAHILEGSVQKAGDAVRINVQLIKAKEDSHLWADTYDRKLTDIFAVETEVAERISRSLAAQLTGGERQQIARVPTANPQAYDAYLRGLALIRRQAISDVKKGRAFMQQAVALDPLYAQAWAQISVAEAQIYFGDEHTAECLTRSRLAAETAVRLQPELSEARSALGLFYYLCLHDYERALVELNEAHSLSPNDGSAIFYIGLVKRRQGKVDEAVDFLKQATTLDPRNQDIWSNLARSYRGKRDFAAAQAGFDRAFAISDEIEFLGDKAECYMAQGDLEAAEKILRSQELGGTHALGEWVNLLVYRRRFDEAIEAFEREAAEHTERSAFQKADDKSWSGSLHILAGHAAEGRRLLEQAHAELQEVQARGDTNPRLAASLLLTSADLGDRARVEAEATALLKQTKDDLWVAPDSVTIVALAWARLGDADRAIPLLTEALTAPYRRALTPALLQLDPVWDPIRKDSRFQALLTSNNSGRANGAR